MSRRKKNPRKRPARTRRGRKLAAEKREARAFWAMRNEKRKPAEPPEPAWYGIARTWFLVLVAGYLAWSIAKWIIE